MSENGYKVHREFIKAADFEALILELPQEEIEDKLAYLAREKGKITKNFYEDFIIATCVANINQLLFSLNQQQEGEATDLLVVREEVVKVIIKHNSVLDPTKLVLNKNNVVKVMTTKRPRKDEHKLSSNKYWELSNQSIKSDEDKGSKVSIPKDTDETKEPKNLDELTYTTKQKWWKRIGQYVQVKKFSPDDSEHILQNRYFHNRTSFGTFVVSVCIDGFEELFALLDEMGIPNRVAPPLLMHELYELCRSCNEFLTYENALNLSGTNKPADDEGCGGSCGSGKKGGKKTASSGSMSKYASKKDKKKPAFKDIPKADLIKLADNMKVLLIGQNEAVETMSDAIQRASVGLKNPAKPIGSFLFAGRTGVGKTEATKVLADELIKEKDNLITIDCSEYSADHEYSKLIGAPSGYVGHEAGGFLTNAVQKNPFSVIVFDEVEKASRKVHELLLQILEEGRLTDGKGKTVDFNQTVIIMTSNVGVSEVDKIKSTIGFGNVAEITEDKKNAALDQALKKKFKPEFLNRIDDIIHFNSLSKEDYMRIIDIEMYKLNDNLKHNDTEYNTLWLKFDKKATDYIYEHGIDSDYGARPLKRCIEQKIATPLARKLLAEKVGKNATIKVSATKKDISFAIKEKEELEKKPFYMAEKIAEEVITDGEQK